MLVTTRWRSLRPSDLHASKLRLFVKSLASWEQCFSRLYPVNHKVISIFSCKCCIFHSPGTFSKLKSYHFPLRLSRISYTYGKVKSLHVYSSPNHNWKKIPKQTTTHCTFRNQTHVIFHPDRKVLPHSHHSEWVAPLHAPSRKTSLAQLHCNEWMWNWMAEWWTPSGLRIWWVSWENDAPLLPHTFSGCGLNNRSLKWIPLLRVMRSNTRCEKGEGSLACENCKENTISFQIKVARKKVALKLHEKRLFVVI